MYVTNYVKLSTKEKKEGSIIGNAFCNISSGILLDQSKCYKSIKESYIKWGPSNSSKKKKDKKGDMFPHKSCV